MVTNLSPDGPGPRPPSSSSAGISRSAKAAVFYSLMKRKPEDPVARELGGRFIAWLLEEASVTWAQAQAPANRRVLEQMRKSDNPIVQNMTMWVEQAEYAHFPPYHPRWAQVYRALTQGMEAIAFRKADARSTLREVTASANDILAQS